MQAPRRVAVVGISGSGKTSLARRVASVLQCDHVELDGIHHQADWTPIDRDEMRTIVSARMASDGWVIDGNYGSFVQDLVFALADTVVWLDLPRRVVMGRIVRRTFGRMAFRRELWNGNRERFRNLLQTDPRENIILWAWTQHRGNRARYERKMSDPVNPHLNWVRLRSTREVEAWFRSLRRET